MAVIHYQRPVPVHPSVTRELVATFERALDNREVAALLDVPGFRSVLTGGRQTRAVFERFGRADAAARWLADDLAAAVGCPMRIDEVDARG